MAQGSLGLRSVDHGSCGERGRNGHEASLEERPSLERGHRHLKALGLLLGPKPWQPGPASPPSRPLPGQWGLFSHTHHRTGPNGQDLLHRGVLLSDSESYRAHGAWFGGECWKQLCEHWVYSTHSSASFPTLTDITFLLFFPFLKKLFIDFGLPWVLVAAHGLVAGAGMWTLVPQPGIRPGSPALGAQSKPLDHKGSPSPLLPAPLFLRPLSPSPLPVLCAYFFFTLFSSSVWARTSLTTKQLGPVKN